MDDDQDPCDWPSGDCVFSAKLRELNDENQKLEAELERYREREPLVRAVFTAIVGNADSYYNTEFEPGAVEAMRECLKTWASEAEADGS